MNKALYFILGVGVGAAGAYFYLKGRFEEKEKELYEHRHEEKKGAKEPEIYVSDSEKELINDKPDIMEYAKKLSDLRYSSKKEESKVSHYIVTEEERENDPRDFAKVALIYYSDGVLAYEADDELFDNAEELIGDEFKDNFKDGEVFVRNEDEQTDYEIYLDERTYEEVSGSMPHGTEE